MRLNEANKNHNRKYHELPVDQRVEFLLKGYLEVFATDDAQKGKFTPPAFSTGDLSGKVTRDETSTLYRAIDNLNFLMTRFNMLEDPQYEGHVRELALSRFEYMFLTGEPGLTQNPQLVATFFARRGKPELIRPALGRMGESAINYEHLAGRIIDSPVFEQYLGEDTTVYRLRTRLHSLVKDDYSKEQAAASLMDGGFDLISCDFNRWYKTEKDFDLRSGKKQYKASHRETLWLSGFVAQRTGSTSLEEKIETSTTDIAPLVPIDDEELHQEYLCSKEGLEALDKRVKYTISEQGNQTPLWVRGLSALTFDHTELSLDSANLVEAKMWDYIWGGQFDDLAYQLKGANPFGKTRKGLNYNKWALLHQEHSKRINPILAQDSYAMIIAGDILVGDLENAIANLNYSELQRYKNADKLRAAVNLAWELMQLPGESDDHDDYELPRAYLYHVANEFAKFLGDNPSAKPYLVLAKATAETELGEEEKILASIRDLGTVETLYAQIGRSTQIKNRFLQIFDETYDSYTEFISIQSEVRGLIQHPTFRRYVDDETIVQRLYAATTRTLKRKSKHDPVNEESGSKKLVLTLYQNSVLHPYLDGRVDIGEMVNGMIDDIVDRRSELLTRPLSLRHQGEISMDPSETIEAYVLADKYRDFVYPQKMQELVAYLLAINSDMTVSNHFSLASVIIDKVGKQADPSYQRPDYFPDPNLGMEEQRIAFLSNVYEREKRLGGIDTNKATIGVTNIIFRGTYVQPGRFNPSADSIMRFLNSPLAELLPKEGLGHDAIKEFRILYEFLRT